MKSVSHGTWTAIGRILDIVAHHYESPGDRLDVDGIRDACVDVKQLFDRCGLSMDDCQTIDDKLDFIEPKLCRLSLSSTEMMRVLENSLGNTEARFASETKARPLNPQPLSQPGQQRTEADSQLGSPSQQSGTGLFSRLGSLFKKDDQYLKADLGKDSSSMRYDVVKKKWLFGDEDDKEEDEVEKKMPIKVGQKVEKKTDDTQEEGAPVNQLLKPRGRPAVKGGSGTVKGKGGPQTVSVPFSTSMKQMTDQQPIMVNDLMTDLEDAEIKLIDELKYLLSTAQPEAFNLLAQSPLVDARDNSESEYKNLYDEAMKQLLEVPKVIQNICQSREQVPLPATKISESSQTDDFNWKDRLAQASKSDLKADYDLSENSLFALEAALAEIVQAVRFSGDQQEGEDLLEHPQIILLNGVYRLVQRLKASKDAMINFETRVEELDVIIQLLSQESARKDDTIEQLEDALIKSAVLEDKLSAHLSQSRSEIETLKEYYWQVSSQVSLYRAECVKLDEVNQVLNDRLRDQSFKTSHLMRINTEVSQKQEDNTEELSKEVTRLERYLRDSKKECDSLGSQLQRVRTDYESLTAKYYDSVQRSNKLVEDMQQEKEAFVRSSRSEKDSLVNEIHHLKSEVQINSRELESKNRSLSVELSKVEELQSELNRLRKQYDAGGKSAKSMSLEVNKLEKELQSKDHELNTNQQTYLVQIESLQAKLDEANFKEITMKNEISLKQNELMQRDIQIGQLDAEISSLKKSIDTNGSRSWVGIEAEEDLEWQNGDQTKKPYLDNEHVSGTNQGIKAVNSRVISQNATKNDDIDLRYALEELRELLTDKEESIATLYTELDELRQYNEGLVADSVQLKLTIDDLQMIIQDFQNQIERQNADHTIAIQAKDQDIAYYSAEVEDLKSLYEQAVRSNPEKNDELNSENQEKSSQAIAVLTQSLEMSQSRVVELEADIEKITEEINNLRELVKERVSDNNRLLNEMNGSREIISEYDKQLQKLLLDNQTQTNAIKEKDDIYFKFQNSLKTESEIKGTIENLEIENQMLREEVLSKNEAIKSLHESLNVQETVAKQSEFALKESQNALQNAQNDLLNLKSSPSHHQQPQELSPNSSKPSLQNPRKPSPQIPTSNRDPQASQRSIDLQSRVDDGMTAKALRDKLAAVDGERRRAESMAACMNDRVTQLEESLSEYREKIEAIGLERSEEKAGEVERRRELEEALGDQRKKVELLQLDLRETREAYYEAQKQLSRPENNSKQQKEVQKDGKSHLNQMEGSLANKKMSDDVSDSKNGLLQGISGMFRNSNK